MDLLTSDRRIVHIFTHISARFWCVFYTNLVGMSHLAMFARFIYTSKNLETTRFYFTWYSIAEIKFCASFRRCVSPVYSWRLLVPVNVIQIELLHLTTPVRIHGLKLHRPSHVFEFLSWILVQSHWGRPSIISFQQRQSAGRNYWCLMTWRRLQ